MSESLLTEREAAALLRLNGQTLRNWRVQRVGPPWLKLGRCVRYDLADLRRWLDGRKVEAGHAQ